MTDSFNDGSAGAPAGTPLLPVLLNGYATTPPWEVAGVNYAVGVPSGTALLNPSKISMAGVSVNVSSHTITVTGSNVTLNGYNFGLNGGWGIDIAAGATNTVIENSRFRVGSDNNVPIDAAVGSGNLKVLDNTINGGGSRSTPVWALISYSGSGTFTAQYNAFLNGPESAIDFNSGSMTTNVDYNVFDNLGSTVQYVGVKSANSIEAFNTIYQPNPSGIQGIQLQAQNGSTLTNTTIENNTIVAKGPSIDMSYSIAVIQNAGNTINGAKVEKNYIDYSGAYGPFYPPSGTNLAFGGNVNLKTGATIPNPGGTSSPAPEPQPVAVADTALTPEDKPISIAVLANDTAGGGTIDPGSVAVDTAAQHGTTAVNTTTGAITYTPATGFTGTDSFQYTVNDANGVAAAPATVTVTVTPPATTGGTTPVTTGGGSPVTTGGGSDGSGNASAGTPQLPNLFSGDAVRPPWQVAGVDYHVGVPTGMALQAPTAADLPAGVSISGQTIIVDASNVTLSGYDFSGNGGYGIYIDSGVSGTTIADNLFVDSSSSAPPAVVVGAGASNTTVENNTINGGGAGGNAGYGETIYNEGSGLTVEYNDIENVPQHFVTTSGGPLVDEFNLMENGAMAPGAHLNFLQYTGSESDPSSVIAYNTLVQSETDGGAGEGFQTYNNGSGAITNAVISNNTMVSLSDVLQSGAPGPAVSYWVHPNSSTSITDNYFGLNSAYGAIYPGQGAAESGNFNLATGGTL